MNGWKDVLEGIDDDGRWIGMHEEGVSYAKLIKRNNPSMRFGRYY